MNRNILLGVVMFPKISTFLFIDLWITNNFISIMKKNWHKILTVLLTRLSYENQVYAHCI